MVSSTTARAFIQAALLLLLTGCPDVDKFAEDVMPIDMGQLSVDMASAPSLDAGQANPADSDAPVEDSAVPDTSASEDMALDDASEPDGLLHDGGLVNDMDVPVQTCEVTFSVGLPNGTPAGGIYIAGEGFDGPEWNPDVPELQLVRADLEASLTLTAANFSRFTYKYTRGSWDTVESSAGCDEIGNRIEIVDCNNGPLVFADQIIGWADGCEP